MSFAGTLLGAKKPSSIWPFQSISYWRITWLYVPQEQARKHAIEHSWAKLIQRSLEFPTSSSISFDGVWVNWGESTAATSSIDTTSSKQVLVPSSAIAPASVSASDRGTTITTTYHSTVRMTVVTTHCTYQNDNDTSRWYGEHCSQCGRTSITPQPTSRFMYNGSCLAQLLTGAASASGSVPDTGRYSDSSNFSAVATASARASCLNSTFAAATGPSLTPVPFPGTNMSYITPPLSIPTTSLTSNGAQMSFSIALFILTSLISMYTGSG
jgi:hypothetical protein